AVAVWKWRGRQRAFAIGFLFVGGIYFLVSLSETIRDYFPTKYPLAWAWKGLWESHVFIPSNSYEFENMLYYNPGSISLVLERFSSEYISIAWGRQSIRPYLAIGHCAWSWVFALLGGWLSERMCSRRQRMRLTIDVANSSHHQR